MKPATSVRQAFEGRLTYEEQQVLENQEAQTRRKMVLAFSGTRTQEGPRIRDSFSELRLLESSPDLQIPSSFRVEFNFERKESGFVLQTQPEVHSSSH
jgi:hypothetical protein